MQKFFVFIIYLLILITKIKGNNNIYQKYRIIEGIKNIINSLEKDYKETENYIFNFEKYKIVYKNIRLISPFYKDINIHNENDLYIINNISFIFEFDILIKYNNNNLNNNNKDEELKENLLLDQDKLIEYKFNELIFKNDEKNEDLIYMFSNLNNFEYNQFVDNKINDLLFFDKFNKGENISVNILKNNTIIIDNKINLINNIFISLLNEQFNNWINKINLFGYDLFQILNKTNIQIDFYDYIYLNIISMKLININININYLEYKSDKHALYLNKNAMNVRTKLIFSDKENFLTVQFKLYQTLIMSKTEFYGISRDSYIFNMVTCSPKADCPSQNEIEDLFNNKMLNLLNEILREYYKKFE